MWGRVTGATIQGRDTPFMTYSPTHIITYLPKSGLKSYELCQKLVNIPPFHTPMQIESG